METKMSLHKTLHLSPTVLAFLALLAAPVGGRGAQIVDDTPSWKGALLSPKPPTITGLKNYIAFYVQLPDGRLMGISEPTVDGVRAGEAAARYSTDNGTSWSEAETLFKLP